MTASSPKQAKFFCENCGAEVPRDAKMCRHCGRFFSSVRCPQCGTTGSPSKFARGCPTCGYAVNGSHESNPGYARAKKTKSKKWSIFGSKSAFSSGTRSKSSYGNGDDSLPGWIYLLVGFGLVILLIVMFFWVGNNL